MPATQHLPAYLTCPEVAAALRTQPSTIYRWAREGVIQSVRVGGIVRVPSAELERIAGEAAHESEELS